MHLLAREADFTEISHLAAVTVAANHPKKV